MNLVAITDIHGRTDLSAAVMHALNSADLIVIAGDITNFGGYHDAQDIIHPLQTINKNIIAIPGNCDRIAVNKYLEDHGISIHAKSTIISDTAFYGIGGSGTTPFGTPQEYSDDEFKAMLRSWRRDETARWHVFITHNPPAHTRLDRTMVGLHVGNKPIRAFIERTKPDLVICGHIHEARGVDGINDTLCINPGTFPKHYVTITLDDRITYQMH